jgi:polyisoprenoid-binding protein YceI
MRPTVRSPARPITAAFVAALLLAAPSAGARAEPHRYTIDPNHFSIGFSANHTNYDNVLGMFLKGQGSFVFDEDKRELSDLSVVIQADSVFTNYEERDKHLRSSDFLWASKHPDIIFVMTEAVPTGERTGKVTGNLTLRGVTRPVTLDVTWNKSAKYAYNNDYAMGLSARTVIKRSDWGITYALDTDFWVGDEIPLRFEIEAIRQD